MRFLIFFLLAYLLYRILRGLIAPAQKPKNRDGSVTIDEMVQDPSCQTYIPLRDAQRRVIMGKEYYFCSKECFENFEKEIRTRGKL